MVLEMETSESRQNTNSFNIRRKSVKRSSVLSKFGSLLLSCTNQYKYLGLALDEGMSLTDTISVLPPSVGSALGSVLTKVAM